MRERCNQLVQFLSQNDLDAILISQPSNRRYYSGFNGSTGHLLLTKDAACFATDFRYLTQAAQECAGFEIVPLYPAYDIFNLLADRGFRRLGVEKSFVSLAFSEALSARAGIDHLVGIDDIAVSDRQRKDADEIQKIRTACAITDSAFDWVLGEIHEGMTEAEIDFALRYFMRKHSGVEKMADTFIVASGVRGCMPHGVATGKKVQRGELITMDFGCNYLGYWSDVTRTICLGKADEKQQEIYACVLAAQERAIAAISAGKTGRAVDSVARAYITASGYGENFGHGLGHSFGLDIHESPRFAQTSEGDLPLCAGMIMSVEPGIYMEGFGGIRIEDDVLITENGCELLSHCNRQLIEL